METREQLEQGAQAWLLRQDAGPWVAEDQAGLETWLAQSAGHRVAYYRQKAAWQEIGRLRVLMGQDAPMPGAPVVPRALAPQAAAPRRRPSRILAWAAGIACVALVAGLSYVQWDSPRDVYATRIGTVEQVALSDGSRVILNTDTRMRVDLDELDRRVQLRRGEAFFEVAHDPSRPFVVEAGNKRIIAVGTAFSVRRFGSDVQVVVTEGRVRVETSGRSDEELRAPLLDAGVIARTQGDAVLMRSSSREEISQSLSWRAGQLVFRDTPMAEAVAEFNRYNTRQLVIEDPAVETLRVGGIFRATELNAFLSLIQQGFPVVARAEKDHVVLSSSN